MLTQLRVRRFTLAILFLQALVSVETFNPALSGLTQDEAVRQNGDLRPQIASLALWLLVILLSHVPRATRFPLHLKAMALPAAYLAWSASSFVWSNDPGGAMPKAVALGVTTYAAWRLATLLTVKEVFDCTYAALAVLLVASAGLALAVPEVGIVQREWQHIGNWQGMFASKQGLGMVSAVFTGIVLLRLADRRTLLDAALFVVGAACLVGSESRGAGVMAAVAVACLIVARLYRRATIIVTGAMAAVLLVAALNIAYFAATGNNAIDAFGAEINVTGRTFIWQYSIGLWSGRPWLGFGLNGFWTDPAIYDGFLRSHGWVLDNFHDGYIGVLVETGLIGFGLLLALCAKLVATVHRLLLTTPKSGRLSLEMATMFLVMFFTINLTETYLSRSTNFLALLFAFLVAKIVPAFAARIVPAPAHPMLAEA